MIFRLDERFLFPDPVLAEPDGLLAVGGDLFAERLLLAYKSGIFPWYSEGEPILWFAPHERMVVYPPELKVSKSMRQVLQRGIFRITVDICFAEVITCCALARREGQKGTWITADMIAAYIRLHEMGHAHSIEVWEQNNLVGGLYGVQSGKVFCGESMFSKVSNASKAAFIYLCRSGLYHLVDCQLYTPHLASMGARLIGRDDYMLALQAGDSGRHPG